MAVEVIKNRKVWIDGLPVACDLNNIALSERVEALDVTNFCSSGRKRVAGLQDFSLNLSGFRNISTGTPNYAAPTSQQIEPALFNKIIAKSSAVVLIAESSAAGAACYIGKGCGAEITQGGSVGDVIGITGAIQGNGPLVRGRVLEYGNLSTAGFTANIKDLGASSTKWRLHASVHVFGSTGAAGLKKRISIQASSDSGFGNVGATMLVWGHATIDNTTSPGTAKYGTTKIPSTKLRYFRIMQKSTAGSTNATFKMAIAAGVSRKY